MPQAPLRHRTDRRRRATTTASALLALAVTALATTSGAAAAVRRWGDRQAPTAPTSLVATAATASSVALGWNASTDNVGVKGYTVYRNGAQVGSTAGTSYTVSSLACGTGYTLGVSAYDAAGNRSATTSVTATTAACAAPQPAPSITSVPTVSGSALVGSNLTASPGTWSGAPTSYTYQWQYCTADMTTCADIVGYTGAVYTPVPDDVGGRDRIKVTAANAYGSTVAYSSPTDVVATATVTTSPPAATAVPTISGTAASGSTLSASTGSWSGGPTAYAYQWRRCDTTGAACGDVTGATSSAYALASADVGATLRVAVTASNAGGSATAVSNATAVVATAPTTSSADFVADPNVTGTLAPWDKFDPGNAASSDGIWVSSQPAGATSPGIVGIANDPLGQQGKVIQETVTPTAHASTASSSDATYIFNYPKAYLGTNGQDNWVHFRMMLPSDYKPTPGEWNIFNEFHNNSNYMSFYNAGQIAWEYPEIALYVTSYTGDVPHLMYRVRGGIDGSDNFNGTDVLVPAQLQLGHWYDIVLHVVWSPSATTGLFEWWLDGTKVTSLHRPTLWQRPDGSTDRVSLELNNYRQHASWNATVYYSKLEVGSSRAAVGF